ncbi:MAG: NADH-quinone oxidoreductase subunit NuoB [Deltaproteobacteria bacterium]|nr:NADH-quinone oxidoreductase subunit NuoB [Deltaproteobacteria bacterium]
MDRNDIKKWFKSPDKMGDKYSLWAIYFCTGCGIIEIPPVITARWDAERFGVIPVATPRQSNLFLITGYVSVKTLRAIIRTYEQMPEPKYTVGFGSCPINGGMYWDSYNTIKHLDKYIPIDGWIAGCMPRPEAIFVAVTHLWTLIDQGKAKAYVKYREKYGLYRKNQEMALGKLDWPPLYTTGGGND